MGTGSHCAFSFSINRLRGHEFSGFSPIFKMLATAMAVGNLAVRRWRAILYFIVPITIKRRGSNGPGSWLKTVFRAVRLPDQLPAETRQPVMTVATPSRWRPGSAGPCSCHDHGWRQAAAIHYCHQPLHGTTLVANVTRSLTYELSQRWFQLQASPMPQA